jgi:hypothetical protein
MDGTTNGLSTPKPPLHIRLIAGLALLFTNLPAVCALWAGFWIIAALVALGALTTWIAPLAIVLFISVACCFWYAVFNL